MTSAFLEKAFKDFFDVHKSIQWLSLNMRAN